MKAEALYACWRGFNVAVTVDQAMSPSELFDTRGWNQKRLPQQLQISRISAVKAANGFLSDAFPSILYCT